MRVLASSLLLLLAASASLATNSVPSSALGSEGELYRVRTGSYGELFPGTATTEPAAAALVLDVLEADKVERWLVPGTVGPDVEKSASVVFESASRTLYVVWVTDFNLVHSRINVAGFREGAWGETIEIAGDPFAIKSSPRLAVTRDTLARRADDGAVSEQQRTILHALWWEEGGLGERILYSPLVLVDGEFLGEIPLFALDGLDTPAASEAGAAEIERSLARAPSLAEGDGPGRLIASFALPRTGRLAAVEIEPVPLELALLAESARDHTREAVTRACAGDTTVKVADSARAHIVLVGRNDLHTSVVRHVSNATAEALAAIDTAALCLDVEQVAREAESVVLETGTDVLRNGLLKTSSQARAHIVLVGRGDGGQSVHRIRVQQTAAWPAPRSGAGDTFVFTSRDGKRSLVAWRDPQGVAFVETVGDARWTEPTVLRTDDLLDADEAIAVLRRRITER